MSLGARLSGITVRAAVEKFHPPAQTYIHNHPDTKLLLADVVSLSNNSVRSLCKNSRDLILFGGPPCQGFSYSNSRHRDRANRLNWLYEEFLRYVSVLQPMWVVFENVRGIKDTANGYFLRSVLTGLTTLGYRLVHDTLNAADFRIPQDRMRYFIVGNRLGLSYRLPRPHHGAAATVHDAFRDLPHLPNGNSTCEMQYGPIPPSAYGRSMRRTQHVCYNNLVSRNGSTVLDRYKHVPQGGNWRDIPIELMTNYRDRSRCHTGIYHRLRLDKPATVVGNFRKNMLIHPTLHRGLSVREAARLQSFPDSFKLKGSIGFQQQPVANAVPPMLAKAVFDSIVACHTNR